MEGPDKAYNDLIKNIRAVGDKIATFIIRDIGLLNPGLINSKYEYAFPVDTWVRQISKEKFGLEAKDSEIKKFFIEKCKAVRQDPLKFAAGIWYLGFNALDIALECIKTFRDN